MPGPSDRERIDVQAAQARPRPLKTGKNFVLVFPTHRLVSGVWDKTFYEPGEEAKLAVAGTHLQGPLKVAVEREEAGSWRLVGSVSAEVDADGAHAIASFHFPKEVSPGGASDGRLIEADWDCAEVKLGEALGIRVAAEGLEGVEVSYEVEREQRGHWVSVERWHGKIEKGKAESRYQPASSAQDAPERGALVSAGFEDGETFAAKGETTWAVVRTKGMDGAALHIEMEREKPDGGWEVVGSAVASVNGEAARAALPLRVAHGIARTPRAGVVSARFDGAPRPGSEAILIVEAEGMEGQLLGMALEVANPDGTWREVTRGTATVRKGSARTSLRLPG